MIAPLFISIFFLSGCIAQRGIIDNYSYLEDAEVTVPNDWTTCKLTIANSIGKIDVQMAPNTADYLVQATIGVYGRDGKGTVDELESRIHTIIKLSRTDYEEAIENIKRKIEELG